MINDKQILMKYFHERWLCGVYIINLKIWRKEKMGYEYQILSSKLGSKDGLRLKPPYSFISLVERERKTEKNDQKQQ